MTRHRFFVPPQSLQEGPIVRLGNDLAHRIGKVLRLREGDTIFLLDGTGMEARAELLSLARDQMTAKIVSRHDLQTEPALKVILYQALIATDRFEWVLEKGTELGVSRFVPLLCDRNTTRLPSGASRLRHKMQRWKTIVRSAAEQSHRATLPALSEPADFAQIMRAAPNPAILAWEQSSGSLLSLMNSPKIAGSATLSIFIGPEGGFTEAEAALAMEAGTHVISLGPRVLRSETAALLLAGLALYSRGDLEANAPASPA